MLDKGIVIVGDIKINLLDIELLTIKLRLLVASVDKAREIGIDWWEHDPALSSRADGRHSLREQNEQLRAEVEELRKQLTSPPPPELSEGRSARRSRPREDRDAEREPRRDRDAEREPRRDRDAEREPRRDRDAEREPRRDRDAEREPRTEPRRTRRRADEDEDRS
ncbi:gas vesicle protein GvpJ [Streptomyces sp. NPDC058960]|uniref:gas vesicle protein n=1 Tax=Streptomyces sp. NPDC058960 TaxID=3346679 RepID=UPI00367AE93F